MIVDSRPSNEDVKAWGEKANGKFSSSSAYRMEYLEEDDGVPCKEWENLWKLKGPARWQFLLWIVRHNRLLSNQEKKRRHIQNFKHCQICGCHSELSMHVLRDCLWIKRIWRQLVAPEAWNTFCGKRNEAWLDWNLKEEKIGRAEEVDWKILFQQVIYHVWNARNAYNILGETRKMKVSYKNLLALAICTQKCLSKAPPVQGKEWTHINWSKPEAGWAKLNVDGAASSNPGKDGGGGVLRDDQGVCLEGFSFNLGEASNVAAELWAILNGLKFAWMKGCRKITIESDSLTAL